MRATRLLTARLAALVGGGATITAWRWRSFDPDQAPGWETLALADAAWCKKGLWWASLWPEDQHHCHLMNCARAEERLGGIALLLSDGTVNGCILPMDKWIRQACRWGRWLAYRAGNDELESFLRQQRDDMTGELHSEFRTPGRG